MEPDVETELLGVVAVTMSRRIGLRFRRGSAITDNRPLHNYHRANKGRSSMKIARAGDAPSG